MFFYYLTKLFQILIDCFIIVCNKTKIALKLKKEEYLIRYKNSEFGKAAKKDPNFLPFLGFFSVIVVLGASIIVQIVEYYHSKRYKKK